MREIKKLKDALATRGLFYFIERERKREVYAERERGESGESERERERSFFVRASPSLLRESQLAVLATPSPLMAAARSLCPLALLALALRGAAALVAPPFQTVRESPRAAPRALPVAHAVEGQQNVITCSNCKASYAVEPDALGSGAGRRVRCSNCDHEWFQSVARLSSLPDNMHLVEYPQEMKDRLAAGKPAEIRANFRAYVGNLPFDATEDDLTDLFEPYGNVVRVNVMMDEDGRSRGFAFVNMEKVEEGLAAVAALDGTMLFGRSLSISEGKQQSSPRGRGDDGGRGRSEWRGRGRGGSRGRGRGGRGSN